MRKKLMMMLLCATMAATALAGCGSKETDVESEESTTVESKEVKESSEDVSAETNTEPVEETKANLDVVIELPPEVQAQKDERLPVGSPATMKFGTITRLGDNVDYPNALEDVEIYFNGQTFQMALPKDLCVDFEYDLEMNVLNIFNEGRTKRAWIFFTESLTPESTKGIATLETMNNVTNYYGYTMLDNAELTTLIDEELQTCQYVPVMTKDGLYNGTYLSYKIYTGEVEESKTSSGEVVNMYPGTSYMFYYGETDKAAAGMATYIAESFVVVGENGNHTNSKPPMVDEGIEDLTKYGMPENVSLPNGTELHDLQGRLAINVANTTDEEMIAFIDAFASEVEWVGTYEFVDTMDGAGIIAECKKTPTLYKFTYTFNGEEYVFNIRYMDGKYTMGLAKNK